MQSNSTFLEEDEIMELTGKKRKKSQLDVLGKMGITFLVRPDHTLVIARKHIEQKTGIEVPQSQQQPTIEPNWDAVNA